MPESFIARILQHQRIVLSTHVRPDGDAIGSELAMGLFLKKVGKEVLLLNSDPPPPNMHWLPQLDLAKTYDQSIAHREAIDKADAILVMDTNAKNRLGRVAQVIEHSSAEKLLIDHHTHPETWFDGMYSRDTASSTGELVYELIAAHDASLIDADIATALYTAIVTDTGSFRFSSVTPKLHRVTAEILEQGGIKPGPIHSAIYDNRPAASLRLLARMLAGITLKYDGRIGYSAITQQMLQDTGCDSDQTEGFVNYVLSIEGVLSGLLFLETANGTKVSFRSTGDTHVNGWAQQFGGGGHRNASGAFIHKPLKAAIESVMEAAPRHIALEDEAIDSGSLSVEDAALLEMMTGREKN